MYIRGKNAVFYISIGTCLLRAGSIGIRNCLPDFHRTKVMCSRVIFYRPCALFDISRNTFACSCMFGEC